MNGLAQVPAWFWIALAAILALGGVTGLVLRHRLRSGVWRWRYRPEHRARPAPAGPLPVTLAVVPVAAVNGKPPWDLYPLAWGDDSAGWASGPGGPGGTEPTAAEVAASRAAHGYIPELDPYANGLGPGAGSLTFPGYNSHLPSGYEVPAKVDSPAPDDLSGDARPDFKVGSLPGEEGAWGESEGSGLTAPPAPPAPTRLLRTTGELFRADLLAEVTAFMARQDVETAEWLAGFQQRWAAA